MSKKQKLIFAAILILAIFFRYYKISEMPGGLFPDEAANGLDINLMQQGHLQPFYERGNGREALFFYAEWASTAAFGVGPWQLHVVSALGGVLAVMFCFLFTRRLFLLDLPDVGVGLNLPLQNSDDYRRVKNRAANIALLAAFLMAASSWHVVLSRTAFRATLIPLFAAMTFYLLLCACQSQTFKKRLSFGFLTGASFALGFYTYIAYRIMAPILLMVLFFPVIAEIKNKSFGKMLKIYIQPVLMFALAFCIFIFPLARYFQRHPGAFIGRAGQVSIFNRTLYTINGRQLTGGPPLGDVVAVAGEVFKKQFLGIFTQGDLNWRQNVSGFPFLSPLVSPFFGIGLLFVAVFAMAYFFSPLKKRGWWKFFLLFGWFFGMMIPVVSTAEGIPHGLRGIGIIPAIFIISAWALYESGSLIMKARNHIYETWAGPQSWQYQISTIGFKSVVVVFVIALTFQTYFLYFIYAYNDPANFYWFRSDLTPVSEYLRDHGSKQNTYLALDKYSAQTTDYLTTVDGAHPDNPKNKPYIQVDPENSWQLNLKTGDQAVFTQSSIFDIAKFKRYHPEAALAIEQRNKFGQAVMAVYKVY